MNREDLRIAMIALGCSKNLVDAECMSAALKKHGYIMTDDCSEANVIIINTCGFIEDAKKEAINAILSAGELKEEDNSKHIIVAGCLPQRYSGDILKEMPEVDIVLGTSHYKDICEAVDSLYENDFAREYVSEAGGLDHLMTDREVSTSGFAWLKIAEGCLHRCSFCAIPLIRGQYISRPIEDIIAEAENLVSKGYKELILAAQDTTNYGIDLYKKRSLTPLLKKLSLIDGLERIRIMYGYMDGIEDELIDEIASNPKVAHYLDIPIQHGDNRVLKAMFRKDSVELITERLEKLRNKIPDLIVRTTVMVGFPGETDEEFENLKNNLLKWRFDRLGCFIFSPEEGTKAYDMPDQIDEDVKQKRYKEIYDIQRSISAESNKKRIGQTVSVTIDSVSEDGIFYIGRSYGEAPEIDPVIYVASSKEYEDLVVGNLYEVKIVDSGDYELTGVTV